VLAKPFDSILERALFSSLDLRVAQITADRKAVCAALEVFLAEPWLEVCKQLLCLVLLLLRKLEVDLTSVDQDWRFDRRRVFLEVRNFEYGWMGCNYNIRVAPVREIEGYTAAVAVPRNGNPFDALGLELIDDTNNASNVMIGRMSRIPVSEVELGLKCGVIEEFAGHRLTLEEIRRVHFVTIMGVVVAEQRVVLELEAKCVADVDNDLSLVILSRRRCNVAFYACHLLVDSCTQLNTQHGHCKQQGPGQMYQLEYPRDGHL